ncbi:family 16 glycosylhydrolase [Sediminibacter sp. Hel_I_10]|uniref:glycoside hydrolase family 16 protein n=1 Tax=Sediminibacter sp. Hel_I_10 TaxID=1392490 RepID=UPI00047D5DBB|nr:glycoside hydrolase family 16 protein [Sediminibacter sp. Hel_I_10]
MKKYIKIYSLLIMLGFIASCQDDEAEFGAIQAPTNVMITAEIVGADANNPNGDGSGFVVFKASADNATGYTFSYGDGTDGVVPSGEVTHRYSVVGVNTYTIVVNALGTGGLSTTISTEVEVFSSFDDLEAKQLLSGGIGNSKTWYLDASEPAHLGVGGTPASAADGFWFPGFYAAAPFEKCGDPISSCLCNDELIFSLAANEQLTYTLDNQGQTFFNGAHSAVGGGPGSGDDVCLDFDTAGTSIVSLSPTTFDWSTVPDPDFEARGTTMSFSGDNFMGYYVGSSTYEIISLTNSSLYVRTIDALNPALYWYHKFTTTPADNEFNSTYEDLVWSDEFDVDGAPDATKWTYDLGAGGWGNQELQTYTNNAENVIVENGLLKIMAKADGSSYTSARLKSENLYEFTYGRVEIRAKLPAATGTWPALWMLGADYETNTWPGCGEIDIMEQTGQDKNEVLATVHHPAVSPGSGDTGSMALPTSTTEFHNYSVDWTPEQITFLIDGELFRSVPNSPDLPFDSDFFMIMNVAMGGTLGGVVDPGFTEDVMEVDYVRVYQ